MTATVHDVLSLEHVQEYARTSFHTIYLPEIAILGDPHLGKTFKTGVPLSRKGEREAYQWGMFKNSLFRHAMWRTYDPEIKYHICVGDLFDSTHVSETVVLDAANAYLEAQERNPETEYFILAGNHDWSRNAEEKSSFDVLAALLKNEPRIHVVQHEPWFREGTPFVLCPWHPFISAKEMAMQAARLAMRIVPYVFGHWDLLNFDNDGGEPHGLLPLAELSVFAGLIVNGHDHHRKTAMLSLPGIESTPLLGVGSMQPFAHGEGWAEDPDPLYVTHHLDKVLENLEANPEHYHSKCLRVLLQEEEIPPDEIDCLQLTFKRQAGSEEADLEVSLDDFNLESVFRDVFAEFEVDPDLTNELWERSGQE